MSNPLLEKPVIYEVNGEEVKLSGNIIKNFLVSGDGDVTDEEVVMFLNLCKFQHLNPFLNEAYLVKFKGNKPAQIIVSKEAFMKRAESHPQFDGFEAGIIVQRNDELVELEGGVKLKSDILVGGWAKVYRKDRNRPTTSVVDFSEFSKSQATWKVMPQNMIRKVAIVNALRETFPDYLGAMYTEEESSPMPQSVNVETPEKSEKIEELESIANSTVNRELNIKQAEVVEQPEVDAVAEYMETASVNFDREEGSYETIEDSPF